ncbi:TPA: hypothetical protein ACRNRG_004923 [Pseudomonas aeruginosa]
MQLLKKCTIAALPLFALSGCALLNIPMPTPPGSTSPEMLTVPVAQICRDADKNPARATELYGKKGLSATGKVQVISEGFKPRYRVLLRAGSASVHAGTDDQLAIKALSTGQTTRVTGIVKDVAYDHNGCSVSLDDAKFY